LLDKIIVGVIDKHIDSSSVDNFSTELNLSKAISDNLSLLLSGDLEKEVENINKKTQLNLFLKRKSSISEHLKQSLDEQKSLFVKSNNGLKFFQFIENHPEFLLVYPIDIKQKLSIKSNLIFWIRVLAYPSLAIMFLVCLLPIVLSLSKLNRFTSVFDARSLARRVKVSRFTYTKEIELGFNRMAEQLEELVEENKILAGSISHDLRTPVACLRFGVDAALETQKTDKKNAYLKRIDEDLTSMEEMLKAFLDYASLERKRFTLVKTQINIVELIKTCIKDNAFLFKSRSKDVVFLNHIKNDNVFIYVDSFWIKRALSNLIVNAADYAESKIQVSLYLKEKRLSIVVEDDGPGIPNRDSDSIFKPFVKLDKSRSNNKNYGLGLAIVKRVISWHNGDIRVEPSKQLGGARFILQFQFA
jgi:signal transduction histidine kinase